MSESLPLVMQSARESASHDGGQELLSAFEALEAEDPGLGWLALWKVASDTRNPVFARTLAFVLAREGTDSPVAEIIMLWFLRHWGGDDLSTLVNILTSIERTLEDGSTGVPPTSRGSLVSFLQRCLRHDEPIVRHSVLDLLETAFEANRIPQFLSRSSGADLARTLADRIRQTADEDEMEVLESVCAELHRADLPNAVPTAPTAVQRLKLRVGKVASRFTAQIGNSQRLVDVVGQQALPDVLAVAEENRAMALKPNLAKLAATAVVKDRYKKQLARIKASGDQTDRIEEAVNGVIKNLPTASPGALVIYGDPQSGKTEMMICLTAKLLDNGHKTIVHLMNDSVDLLMQNLDRFKRAGLAPAPRNSSDLANSPLVPGHEAVVFCKKNAKDLNKLISALAKVGPVIVIDDEADYATPNAKVNTQEKTKINALVTRLLASDGRYIGVTATPARLNLNNTFNTKTETWVRFRPHDAYTGQDHFFPLNGPVPYRLTLLSGPGSAADARNALARFLVTVAYLNTTAEANGKEEQNYSFLVHTSGKTDDHKTDRKIIDAAMTALVHGSGPKFDELLEVIYQQAKVLYPAASAEELTKYVIANASRSSFVVLNSKRDRATAGDRPTVPTCPFTVIIGGNIVSRGVTFPNLLAMFFTRDVATKLQQDTYIQRARMFGARGAYLEHFELTIPKNLYDDWHRCFVFHRLALYAIENNKVSPVWVGDPRISIASSSSIDRSTVDLNKGEMSFQIFEHSDFKELDKIIEANPKDLGTLRKLAKLIGDALPTFLIDYLEAALEEKPDTLAIHTSNSIEGYGESADSKTISRPKGFLGKNQLEEKKFPGAIHHIKILYNGKGKARVFYKNLGGVQFVQNVKAA